VEGEEREKGLDSPHQSKKKAVRGRKVSPCLSVDDYDDHATTMMMMRQRE
jgi:hypothetical protein